uniref:Lipid transfer protein n=1 Tax=Picea abies TaxID=3329 RepID=O22110_PICAB|nr:lipid transfer protein [Picea abies]
MDSRRLKRSGIVCMVLMSMLMLVVCEDSDNTACLSSLSSCAPYLNATTKPDSSCCSALISVIDKDSQCLCNLLNSDTVKQLGVNVTQAMKMPAECGKNVSATQCNKTATSGGSSVGKTPTSTPPPSSATPSTTTITKSNSNAAASVSVKMFPVAALVFVAVASVLGLKGPCLR